MDIPSINRRFLHRLTLETLPVTIYIFKGPLRNYVTRSVQRLKVEISSVASSSALLDISAYTARVQALSSWKSSLCSTVRSLRLFFGSDPTHRPLSIHIAIRSTWIIMNQNPGTTTATEFAQVRQRYLDLKHTAVCVFLLTLQSPKLQIQLRIRVAIEFTDMPDSSYDFVVVLEPYMEELDFSDALKMLCRRNVFRPRVCYNLLDVV